MASAVIFTPTSSIICLSSLSSSSSSRKQAVTVSVPHFSTFEISVQLGFAQWNGLKKIQGMPISPHLLKIEMKRKRRDKGVYASLFGVGAPEALVIGVVALLVFGPKGLAEVARNLGKTLRAFQPTIRELQDVSREFKSTLEREIGLDDIQTTPQDRYTSSTTTTTPKPSVDISSGDPQMKVDPNGSPSVSKAYSSEDYLKITEEQLRAASAAKQLVDEVSPSERQSEKASSTTQERTVPASTGESQSEIQIEARDTREEAASTVPSPGQPKNET